MELRDQLQSTLGTTYSIERELAGGGMSRVFAATEVALGRTVVIKVLPADMAGQVSIDRFKREISLAARLQHAHIVPLLNAGESGGLPYFTMPFIEGESLRVRIARHGELPLNDAVRMLREVASALAYAHERGIVHRDIKPDNVLLSGGAAMVTDFGVAKALSASSNAEEGKVTSLGVALGTPAYMAPEQATADPAVDHRADIYAFGALAYEILSGQPPFVGRSPQALLAAHITETPESIAKRRPNIPPALAALVMRCLEKRAADRPQSATEIVHTLDDITTPSGGTAPLAAATTVAPPKARSVRWRWIAGGVAVLTVGAGVAMFAPHRGTTAVLTTVAVFPFENATSDTSMAYFADGMTDELSAALGDAGLRVIGRASVLAVQARHLSDQDAGRALGAGMILHGRVARAADRLRVWTQLINAADGAAIATKAYDTTMTNMFAVQDGLARVIAAALRPSVSPSAAVTPSRSARGTDDVQAYEAFLKGNYYLDGYHPSPAIAAYRQAIARDPKFAQAFAALSKAYSTLAEQGAAAGDSTYARARELAVQALALDSLLPAAHDAFGKVLSNDLRLADALNETKRASDLAPDNAEYLVTYAGVLGAVGRVDESLQLIQRALALDPLSVRAMIFAQYGYYGLGRYREAIDEAHRALDLDSASAFSWSNLAVAYSAMHKPDSALVAYRRWYALGNTSGAADYLVLGYALAGRWAEAAALRDSLRSHPSDNSPSLSRMLIDMAWADFDDAMTALEVGFDHREPVFATMSVSCDPMFDYLKPNPRFGKLMDRYGIKPCPARNVWPVPKPPR
jgi:eukaryotic-like serine/threonine-protein kinase